MRLTDCVRWVLFALCQGLIFCGIAFCDFSLARASPSSQDVWFQPESATDVRTLMSVVRDRAASLQADHLELDIRRFDAQQSRLFDNPVLDAAVGTIPIGPSNPPDLPTPLRSIPNYSVGLGMHLDLARRSARIERADLAIQASAAQLAFAIQGQAIRLLRAVGDLAVATLRLAADQRLTQQARQSLYLAKERVKTGFGPPLDSDRAEIELLRLEQQVSADQGDILSAQATCAELVGMRCGAFADESAARLLLSRWIVNAEEQPLKTEERADLKALLLEQSVASAEARLSQAVRIPDPTLRVGYTYDSFVVSGNQQHSMNVSMTLPLVLADRGQVAAQAANARVLRYREQHRLTIRALEARAESLRSALASQRQRLRVLQEQVLPRAQSILRDVRRAFEARAVPLTDMNQAQRALDELQLQEASALSDIFRLSVDLVELRGRHD
ncbi:MAG: TolC family protein [Myxococcales bacterium]|nr:TolC family protein [Myxococcales bacterium]